MATKTVTLYEYVGERPMLRRVADAHYRRCLTDPVLTQIFGTTGQPEHVDHLADWLSEVFGGPKLYTEKHGGHGALLRQHADLGITERHRRHFVQAFIEAADEVGLSDNPTFRQRLRDYLDWGSRIALEVSQPGADTTSREPVPVWGWGSAGPPRS